MIKQVILMSHLGRPSCKDEKFSLKWIIFRLQELLGVHVVFSNDCIGSSRNEKLANDLNNGEVLVLENLRFYKRKEAEKEIFRKAANGLMFMLMTAFGGIMKTLFYISNFFLFFLTKNTLDYY